jgi:hypothetical protein
VNVDGGRERPQFPPDTRIQLHILHGLEQIWEPNPDSYEEITNKNEKEDPEAGTGV